MEKITEPQIRAMAFAIERNRIASARYWSMDQMYTWCYDDPYGKKSYATALKLARAAARALEKTR